MSPDYKVSSFTLDLRRFYAAVVSEGASMGETRGWTGSLDPNLSSWLLIIVEHLRLILSIRKSCTLYMSKGR